MGLWKNLFVLGLATKAWENPGLATDYRLEAIISMTCKYMNRKNIDATEKLDNQVPVPVIFRASKPLNVLPTFSKALSSYCKECLLVQGYFSSNHHNRNNYDIKQTVQTSAGRQDPVQRPGIEPK